MNTQGTQNINEYRHFQAVKLSEEGWSQRQIAKALGVTQGSISQWLAKYKNEGKASLLRHPQTGRPLKLSKEQRAVLPMLLELGAEAFHFEGDVWTCQRIGLMIKAAFGVSYHPAHISRMLRQIGWTLQVPARVASQRDEEAISKWLENDWPRIKKTLKIRDKH